MFTEVQGKPLRGIISDVQFSTANGRATAILQSPDFLSGQEGRHTLTQGRDIMTSQVEGFDVKEGQLVMLTRNSAYVVEGSVGIWEVTLSQRITEWEQGRDLTKPMGITNE